MTGSPAQLRLAGEGVHLVLYDGVCGLCNRLLQFLLKHDHRAVLVFASLQSDTGRAMVERSGGNADELTSFYVVTNYQTDRERILSKSDAALFVARELGWPWKAASGLRVLPAALRDAAYALVARHRYRVFGRYDQCLLPRPEYRDRFVE
ncbi:MAG TPA: DCC1-like thiol-disulfide oxidoreductase family protein [Vicinamibacterales bacterium]|nr:DCC1-like thiol-disulfide oxidoreductase family protein [Vicinamibacterales bacterium]